MNSEKFNKLNDRQKVSEVVKRALSFEKQNEFKKIVKINPYIDNKKEYIEDLQKTIKKWTKKNGVIDNINEKQFLKLKELAKNSLNDMKKELYSDSHSKLLYGIYQEDGLIEQYKIENWNL